MFTERPLKITGNLTGISLDLSYSAAENYEPEGLPKNPPKEVAYWSLFKKWTLNFDKYVCVYHLIGKLSILLGKVLQGMLWNSVCHRLLRLFETGYSKNRARSSVTTSRHQVNINMKKHCWNLNIKIVLNLGPENFPCFSWQIAWTKRTVTQALKYVI